MSGASGANASGASAKLASLNRAIVRCRACPRLVAHREAVAETKRRRYLDEVYWGKPVTGFGEVGAPLVVLGLAPGAHGANRTGRVFTGDRSGDFLYAALHRAGLASQPTSTGKGDGLVLRGVFVTLAARCVPPDNRPSPDEVARCGPFLDRELAAFGHGSPRVVLALGAIAWDAFLDHLRRVGSGVGIALPRPRPRFAHDAVLSLEGAPHLVGSYHVSQQNTQTGRLTEAMFDRTLARAVGLATRRNRSGSNE